MSTDICRWLFLLICLSTWTMKLIDSKEMRIVCYYTNWSVYRPGQAKFSPQNINPYLCTHLVYAFGGFTKENTLKPFDKYQDIEKGGYAKFTGLKTYNKNLKTLIAIGGWNEGSSRFSPMVASAERRKELAKNAIKFLRQNHFDGLDLDWEYPAFRDGGKTRDRENYALLVKELREEFERESEKTGRPRLLLTMAVPAGIEYINKGYDIAKLTKYLDWMNILSYDYHSAFEPAVNHHAPLYSLEEPNEYNYGGELNIDYTIKHYLKLGADPAKLILGIPTYGRSYTLFNPEAVEIGSPADGPGDMGEATRENGYLAYYEICENVKNQEWEVDEPNPDAMGPIAFKGNQWVGYDDENIVRKKATYVAENGLGGIMFWAIDNDDFRGNCHGRPYPLIEAGKEALLSVYGSAEEENLISPPVKTSQKKTRPKLRSRSTTTTSTTTEAANEVGSTAAPKRSRFRAKNKVSKPDSSSHSSLKVVTPSYTTPAPPATPDMGGDFKCEDEGFFPHPKDCKKYYWCLGGAGETGIIAHQFTCPAGLYFNKAADSCDYSQNVLCKKKLQKLTTTSTEEPSSTTTTTTTKPITTTTKRPSSNPPPPRFLFRSTTTTTTESPEEENEEDEESPSTDTEEEDPRVIKELIALIKKAGGLEELEKQLGGSTDSKSNSDDSTTQSGLSKSLYQRVLSKTNKSFRNRNSGGVQGRLEEDEPKKQDKERPRYSSITRKRASTEAPTVEEDIDQEDKDFEKSKSKSKSTLEYVNIRRPKSSTSTTESNDDDRNRILGEISDQEPENTDAPEVTSKRTLIPQYVNIQRQRYSTSTETPSSSSKYISIRRTTVPSDEQEEEEEEEEEEEDSVIHRRRGTTTETPLGAEITERISTRYQTIRRSTTTTTTTTPSSLNDNKDKPNEYSEQSVTKRRRPTTESTSSTKEIPVTELKYKFIQRTTTIPSTTVEIITEYNGSNNGLPETTISGLPEVSISNGNENSDSVKSSTNQNNRTEEIKNEAENHEDPIAVVSTAPPLPQSSPAAINEETTTKKRRPIALFHPRLSTTKSSNLTVTPKVSDTSTNNKFRLRGNSAASITTSESTNNTLEPPTTHRTRGRFSYNSSTKNLNEDTEQQKKIERIENKPIRARKRLVVPATTTESTFDSNVEANRKYRPAELADLSSLTSADLKRNEINFAKRRRRPTTPTTTATSTTPSSSTAAETSPKRTVIRVPLTRAVLPGGENRRIGAKTTVEDQVNAGATSRNVLRRFRSSTSRTTTTTTSTPTTVKEEEEEPSATPQSEVVEQSSTANNPTKATTRAPIRRKIIRRFRPTFSTSTVPTTTKTNSVIEIKDETTKSPLNQTASTDDPLAALFKTTSRFDLIRNNTDKSEEDEEEEHTNEHSDVLNGEEGENIKLSESNIRESSHINTFGVDEKYNKQFSKVKAPITITSTTTTTSTTEAPEPSQVPNRILRTRKIIRRPTISTTTESARTTIPPHRRRKVVRPLNANQLVSERTTSSTARRYPFSRSTSTTTTENSVLVPNRESDDRSKLPKIDEKEKEQDDEEKEVLPYRKLFRPNFGQSSTTSTEPTKLLYTPRYNLYTRSTTERNEIKYNHHDDNEDEEDDDDDDHDDRTREDDEDDDHHLRDDDDDDDEDNDGREDEDEDEEDTPRGPKFTIYTTSSVSRTHKFESNTNFNDEDQEDNDDGVKANKTVTKYILKTASNSLNESETLINKDKEAGMNADQMTMNGNGTEVTESTIAQKDRPIFSRHKVSMTKEEQEAKMQEDLLRKLPKVASTSEKETEDSQESTTQLVEASTDLEDDTNEMDLVTTTLTVPEQTWQDLTEKDLITSTEPSTEITTEIETTTTTSTSTTPITTSTTTTTTTKAPTTTESTTASNVTETTTEYRPRSTLRSIRNRVPYSRRPTRPPSASTASTVSLSTVRSAGRQNAFSRSRFTPRPSTVKTPSTSTTEREPETETEDVISNTKAPVQASKPTESKKFKSKLRFSNTPVRDNKPTVAPTGINSEVLKKRNENLYAKRKQNLPVVPPVVISSTSPSSTSPEINVSTIKSELESPTTLASESSSMTNSTTAKTLEDKAIVTDSTESTLTTLHHVFAEVTNEANATTESSLSSSNVQNGGGKQERLIEVNRIVEVKTKEAKVRNHAVKESETKIKVNPTVDKIGEISRVVSINVVDGTNEAILKNAELNEVENGGGVVEAKVEEIPASELASRFNLKNVELNVQLDDEKDQRKDRKYEIYGGNSKVADNKVITNSGGKPEIIDGISHINVVTPKSILNTVESSTISLEGLFQNQNNLNPSFTMLDETLETGRSEFVNVRLLEQDDNHWNNEKAQTSFVPVRILPQNVPIEMKARVEEIPAQSRTFKIVPIQVEMFSKQIKN